MFALSALAPGCGLGRVAVTTTTKIRDPRFEVGRRFDEVVVDPRLASPRDAAARIAFPSLEGTTVLASRAFDEEGALSAGHGLGIQRKLDGIHPSRPSELALSFDLVLVEADGARGRSIKAPAEGEPVLPDDVDLVVALVGLDCLGAPLDERIAHRPELLGPLALCAPGDAIRPRHVAALLRSPVGLFKLCPPRARRVLLLNKADLVRQEDWAELLALLRRSPSETRPPADMVFAGALRDGGIERILDLRGGE